MPRVLILLFFLTIGATAERKHPAPKVLAFEDLRETPALSPQREQLIRMALAVSRKHRRLPYTFGGATPSDGGFDCSGAMSYVLKKAGFTPPRTSAGQYLWVRDSGKLHTVSKAARNPSHPSFHDLKPGDLVFWSGTYAPRDGRKVPVTHVGLYLGTEKSDGRPVIICASRGRSYRRQKGDGFGIYDFRVPSKKSRSKLIAYGPPPGLE